MELEENKTPVTLTEAATLGRTQCVSRLIAEGSNVNGYDSFGNGGGGPLVGACNNGHELVASLLISAGADVDLPDEMDFTPLMAAAGVGHCVVVR